MSTAPVTMNALPPTARTLRVCDFMSPAPHVIGRQQTLAVAHLMMRNHGSATCRCSTAGSWSEWSPSATCTWWRR